MSTAVRRPQPLRRPSPTLLGRVRDGLDGFAFSSPSRFAITVFTGLILLLTLLLALPISSRSGSWTPVADALFTAVSTICVTGLTTVDMANHWSAFGHACVFIGMQIGGIGVLTLASIMGLVMARKLGLRAKLMVAGDNNPLRMGKVGVSESQAIRLGEIGGLLATVAISTLVIEAALAALIIPRLLLNGLPLWDAIWEGFFFSASAFTNTGFVPHPQGLAPFADDVWMLGVIALGVTLGSLGFPVIFAVARYLGRRQRLTLHAKLTLTVTLILYVVGTVLIYALEWNNQATLGDQEPLARPLNAAFLSIVSRSGGFSTIDISELNGSTLLVLDALMFIGGGSASTAGGIKVTTIAVLFLAAWAEARGVEDIQVFSRRIPHDVLHLAISILLWAAVIVGTSTVAVLHLTKAPLDFVLFDVISAFATTGLSTGLTESVDDPVKYILAATMWAGRVGTVTLATAIAATHRRQLYRRPEERPIVG